MYNQDCLIKVRQHNVSFYNLRSSAAPRIELPDKYELDNFQDQAASAFNNLPAEIRLCTDFTMFCKRYVLERNILALLFSILAQYLRFFFLYTVCIVLLFFVNLYLCILH